MPPTKQLAADRQERWPPSRRWCGCDGSRRAGLAGQAAEHGVGWRRSRARWKPPSRQMKGKCRSGKWRKMMTVRAGFGGNGLDEGKWADGREMGRMKGDGRIKGEMGRSKGQETDPHEKFLASA
ncbi:hypothetical protein Dimus_036552 [Dionaea muscipula]